ncbi:MAG TPA: tRNA pseudouridine(38-40) synthase TruA [Melioribacteraceae bacterium]|nr:tRNA pseudouridine(38-40) synthase TruA [Melioribacteraceae bacterium]
MNNNYKLIISYNGSKYAGWQQQKNAITVQEKLINTIEILLKEKVNLIGAGRTDTGVNALGQVANFRTDIKIEDLDKFCYSLNSLLPNDISIKKIECVNKDFHSRFDAKSRSYLYLFLTEKDPFYHNFAFYYPKIAEYSINKLNEISKQMLGRFDFTSFSKRNTDTNHNFCTVTNVCWRKAGNKYIFLIEADRYLHGMVRTTIGTILRCINNNEENGLINVIKLKNRIFAGESVPAKGLFLYKIKY